MTIINNTIMHIYNLFALTFLFLLIQAFPVATKCDIHVEESEAGDGGRIARRGVQMAFTEECAKEESIEVNLHREGIVRSFKKVDTKAPRKGNVLTSQYTSWFGEDESDGSMFSIIRSTTGKIVGSMVDLSNGNIWQFRSFNGTSIVTTKADSAFEEELDAIPPKFDDEGKSNVVRDHSKFHEDGSVLDIMIVYTKRAECEGKLHFYHNYHLFVLLIEHAVSNYLFMHCLRRLISIWI